MTTIDLRHELDQRGLSLFPAPFIRGGGYALGKPEAEGKFHIIAIEVTLEEIAAFLKEEFYEG
ncbi:MAG TPA: hypothetical protein DCG72_08990 [Gammaproteobacteria bacterium]|nr:hypothetical protein [Gammaproteobacteria bacterium]